MRRLLALSFLLLLAAKGGKKKNDAPEPAPAPVETPAPAPVPEEPAPPPPPPEPKVVKNANFTVTITYADGSTKAGHVTGVERTIDSLGDQGWGSEPNEVKLTVESGSSEKSVTWADIKSVSVTPGKMPDDVDCTYSSDFSPWMYECSLRTTTAVVLKDGSKGNITSRNQWRFTFEDGSTLEFQVYKFTVREQDTTELQYGDEANENPKLYTKLQDQIRTELKGKMVKSVTVQ
jgi:hypothetical protein